MTPRLRHKIKARFQQDINEYKIKDTINKKKSASLVSLYFRKNVKNKKMPNQRPSSDIFLFLFVCLFGGGGGGGGYQVSMLISCSVGYEPVLCTI